MELLFAAVAAAFFDSFNPMILAQTLWLLGRAKKPERLFCYTLSVGATNLAFGLAVYYGLSVLLQRCWQQLALRFAWLLPAAQLLLGVLAVGQLFYALLRRKMDAAGADRPAPRKEATGAVPEAGGREYSIPQMVLAGVSGAACEISTSLPYFAFIGVLLRIQPVFPRLILLLLVYNLVFTLPLHLLVLLYMSRPNWVEQTYRFLAGSLFYYGGRLLPYLIGAGGCALIFRGLWNIAN